MVIVEIINEPIESFQIANGDNQNGAELVFNGKVRATEKGKPIKYLEFMVHMSQKEK